MSCEYHAYFCEGIDGREDMRCMDCRCDKQEQNGTTIKAVSADRSVVVMFVVVIVPNPPNKTIVDMPKEEAEMLQ